MLRAANRGRGAVALVVMRHRPAAALPDRQPRLGAIKGLDLALFIDRQVDELKASHHGLSRKPQRPSQTLCLGPRLPPKSSIKSPVRNKR